MSSFLSGQDKASWDFNIGKSMAKKAGHEILEAKSAEKLGLLTDSLDSFEKAKNHINAAKGAFKCALESGPNDKLKRLIIRKMSGLPSNDTYIDRQIKKLGVLAGPLQ
ncbi:Uncharacterised protein [uncultured archaeon]|nr:Uncharacterised protein [uncultured archaeon]